MDDAISRQAAINLLKKWSDGYSYIEVETNSAIKAFEEIQSAQQWIPCSERLPENNGRYLVTRGLYAAGNLWNRVYITNYSDLMGLIKEKIFWQGNVGKSDFQVISDVVAWQPLPTPYKEEE